MSPHVHGFTTLTFSHFSGFPLACTLVIQGACPSVGDIDKDHHAGEDRHDEEEDQQDSVKDERHHAPLTLVVVVGVAGRVSAVDLLVQLSHVGEQLTQNAGIIAQVLHGGLLLHQRVSTHRAPPVVRVVVRG